MDKIIRVTPAFAVTGAMAPEDFEAAARLGFKAIISNRPDGEASNQLTADDEAVLAQRAGLQFCHVPATKHEIFTDAVVARMADALAELDGPILAHCASGTRSLVAWAAAHARVDPVATVLDKLRSAGQDMDFLRDELEAQAARAQRGTSHTGEQKY